MARKAKGKHRLDKYYHLAKEQGYRSRAAFKLLQLNRQFRFLQKARTCVDLCAAPGGWMQVASKEMPLNAFILGIDLDPIKPIKGCKSIVGDITTNKARAAIKKESGGQKIEVVLHDGAPNVGGVWASEAYTQSALVLEALRLATDVLTPQGTFVTKIFRSQDYNALLYAFKQLFTKVEATKPAASRNTSAEIFVVCLGYKAPAKIDPRLLDPKHLFQEVVEAPKSAGPDALLKAKIKQKRFREGYAEGLSSLFKQTSAAAFIVSESPVEMLGQYTRFSLDGPDADEEDEDEEEDKEAEEDEGEGKKQRKPKQALAPIAAFARQHPATNTEIRTLLDDLQVLGRSEFKQLLKWRLKLKKELDVKSKASASKEAPVENEDQSSEEDEEEKLLREMQEVKAQADQRQKRDKKKRIENKKKSRIRAAQLAMGEGIGDDNGPNPLFSLAAIKGDVKAADLGDDAEVPDDDAADSSNEEEEFTEDVTDYDTDEERRQYEAEQEEAMEEAYKGYLYRQGQRAKAAAEKRARLEKIKPGDILSEVPAETGSPQEEGGPMKATRDLADFPEDPKTGGGLLVESGPDGKTPAEKAKDWYSQEIFKEFGGLIDPEDLPKAKRQKTAPQPDFDSSDEEAEEDNVEMLARQTEDASDHSHDDAVVLSNGKGVVGTGHKTGSRLKEDEFEVVPQDATDSEGSESDVEEPDGDEAAEIRAVAKAMLKGRTKNDMIENGYHRYAFNDTGLPIWFAEDEKRHMKPPALISKEEIEAEKERMRAVDARPVKKIAEAKARKKKRLQVRLEQAKSKANAVMDQGDLSERAKAKEVASLMAKAKAGAKNKKKPTRNDKFKKKGPPLDRRLFSDKRQIDNKKKKAAAKARKKKSGGGGKNKGKR